MEIKGTSCPPVGVTGRGRGSFSSAEIEKKSSVSLRKRILMYGKEASNRKQEIDRQHMEKLKCSFPTSCKQSYPQFHKTASYTHSHNADDYGIPLILTYKGMIEIKHLFQCTYTVGQHLQI